MTKMKKILKPFQIEGAKFLKERYHALLADEMGCISGQAEIVVNRGGNARRYTLEQAYHGFNCTNPRYGWKLPAFTRSFTGDHFFLNRIRGIVRIGFRDTVEVTTEAGYRIIATPDHEFITPEGDVAAEKLQTGGPVYTNGVGRCAICGAMRPLSERKFKGVCRECVYRQLRKCGRGLGETIGKGGYAFVIAGLQYHPRVTSTGIAKHRLVYEASMNGVPYGEYLARLAAGDVSEFVFLTPADIVHHIDGDIANNTPGNLEVLSPSDHGRAHGKKNALRLWNVCAPKIDRVKSVKHFGLDAVYDVKMDGPHHNFIANGFVVHNCGKTITALAATEMVGAKNVVVVCPASVRTNWKQEIEECGLNNDDFHVMSYNAATTLIPPAEGLLHDVMILDEAHFLKNSKSLRCQAIFGNGIGLARRARRIWGLTGTPVLNRPRELYPILKTLHNDGISPFNTWEKFTQRFCGAFFDGRGINTKGASHIEELRKRLEGFMLRREKKDVLKELPPRIVSHPPIELSAEELKDVFALESEIGDREAYLSPTHEDYAQLGDMARLLKVTGVAKVKKVAAFVEDLLESGAEKVVIFARHRDVIKGLENEMGHHCPVWYHGGMNDEQKRSAVNRFVDDKSCSVFIGQIQAAGTGINGLQKVCSNIVFAELDWVPGVMAQAIDRCHRIGQTADAVNVYCPHVVGTLESAMLQVQLGKGKVIEALVGVRENEEENLLEGLV